MSEGKHTPGHPVIVRDSTQLWIKTDFGERHIADCIGTCDDRYYSTQLQQSRLEKGLEDGSNAQRLAHCWNNHDALLEACLQAAATFERMAIRDTPALIPEARQMLRVAIQAATGGK